MTIPAPAFNLTINIWHFGSDTTNPPDEVVTGNLAWGKRTDSAGSTDDFRPMMVLLVPWGTDIRGDWNTDGLPDTVEVADGDGWWYEVLYVDRAGHSFPNQHMNAVIRLYRGNVPPAPGTPPVVGGGTCLTAVTLPVDTPTAIEVPPGTGSLYYKTPATIGNVYHVTVSDIVTPAPGQFGQIWDNLDCTTRTAEGLLQQDVAHCQDLPSSVFGEVLLEISQNPHVRQRFTVEVGNGPCGGGGGGDTLVTSSGDTLVTSSGDTLIT